MKKVLDYFTIDGAYGGNQDWFTNVVMHFGGCGAATACDSCIYLAKYKGMEQLYPYDISHLNKDDYKKFSQIMKPYIKPRIGGVKKLEWYIEGLTRYISDVNEKEHVDLSLPMDMLSGTASCVQAKQAIIHQIDRGYPVPYLMLEHTDRSRFEDFIWHWFLVVGYEEKEEGGNFLVTAATYGEASELPFEELWDTGYEEKGGLILYRES